MSPRLTERQREVLRDLVMSGHEWVRPMDIGGRDGSHHSGILHRLAERGLVERRSRSAHSNRGSYVYRATAKGVALAGALR